MIIQGVTLNGTRVVDASFITQNLVIYLDADKVSSYSGSGTTLNDLSGNGYTHTLSNSGLYTMLNGVKCFNCSSVGQIITSVSGTIQIPANFTYISWVRVRASTSGFRTLLRSNGTGGHAIIVNTGTNLLGMWDNTTATGFVSSGYNMSAYGDVWAQFATVGDASGQTFYINGQQVGSSVAKSVAGEYHYAWGNIQGAAVDQPWGYVANLELYNTKFTAEQLRQNYYNMLPTFTIPNIVTSNLVFWYDPSDPTSYPGTGTTISNLASTSLAGSMSNVTYTDPYFTYNGTSSTTSVADNALLEPGSGDFTLEAWVYYSAIAGSSRVIVAKTDGGNSADWGYGIRTISNGSTYLEVGNGSTTVTSPTYTVTTGQWYHIVGVYTNVASNSIELYVNGVSQGSNSHSFASIKNTTRPLFFGSFDGGATFGQWFNGRMGATRMYNAALTAGQVLQNYNANRGTYGL
jgi:hypothetical protein